jgi:hypothetical protein
MSTGRMPRWVVLISCVCLLIPALVVGALVALGRAGAHQAASAASSSVYTGATSSPATAVTDPVVLPVPALRHLTPPDVVVMLLRPTDASTVEHLRALPGVRAVALADRGSIRLGQLRLRALGVPIAIRGFTPSLTATSAALWHSVARGEITVAFANSRPLSHRLGATLKARGSKGTAMPIRVGAFATIGLPGGDALVSRPVARSLGLALNREVLIAAPKLSVATIRRDVHTVFGSYAQTTIPADYLALYRRAAPACPGLPWTVLAAIGTVETGNGRDVHRSIAGAEGPMQFLPSTWATWGYDADGDGKADINDPVDAVFSAVRYLCAAGAGRGGQSLNDAIFAYNHAWWYVREVVDIANQYA